MSSSPSVSQLELSGAFNVRDLGGLRTQTGTNTKPGVLLRSAQLSALTDSGQTQLRELGVTAVHDLRGPQEIDHIGQDRLPQEIHLINTPFDHSMGAMPPHDPRPGAARARLLAVYREFPVRPEAHHAIVAIAESIARDKGAVLVHCAAGKDRTGWAIATLLTAVGVMDTDIVTDFRRSNSAISALRQVISPGTAPHSGPPADLLGVRDEYLHAAFARVREHYGTLENYLCSMGLRGTLRTHLRARFLPSDTA